MPIIHRVRLGTCNTYFIGGNNGFILVDAGNAGKEKNFFSHLKEHNISPDMIKLIIVTHVHFDHVGSLGAIKNICKCPVAVHEKETGLLQEGKVTMPPGTNLFGKTVSHIGKGLAGRGFFRYNPVKPDIVLFQETPLVEFGVDGFILPTPGHTEGSLSAVLQTGEAFVGDLAVNFSGFVFPPFAQDTKTLLQSWKKLMQRGVKTIHPGHGRPFPIDLLEKSMGK